MAFAEGTPQMTQDMMDYLETLLMEPKSPLGEKTITFVNLQGKLIKDKRCQDPSGCFKRAQSH